MITRNITKSRAAEPSLQIAVNLAGATLSNPCHLHVHEFNVPIDVLEACLLVMTKANIVVKRVAKRDREEDTAEMMFRVWNLDAPLTSQRVSSAHHMITYHRGERGTKIDNAENQDTDTATDDRLNRSEINIDGP